MLDIKTIREKTDWVCARLAARNAGDDAKLKEIIALDDERRKKLAEVENLKAQRNKVSKEIGALMGKAKGGHPECLEEANAKKQETANIGNRITELDKQLAEIEVKREELLLRTPNTPHDSVPPGKDSADNPVVKMIGTKPEFSFKPLPHTELCEKLGLVDFKRGTKISGSGFILYTGKGARLERALINFLLDLHTTKHEYKEIFPPFMVSQNCMYGVGQFPKFKDQAYTVQEGLDASTLGTHYLVPTAEAPLTNIHRDEILKEEQLPIRYCAYTPCFRAEAGAAGVGTRGLIRVHQFDKVELVKIVKPEESYNELERLLEDAEEVLKLLGLHYRVVLLCTGDMGFTSAKTYDIEVWAPGQDQYLEVSSCSNCEDYQARRMGLRYKSADGGNRYPHMLNGSGTALARLYVALLETYQQADGTVLVPEILRPYLGGVERLVP